MYISNIIITLPTLNNKTNKDMLVTNIKWETDGYEVDLPTEVEVDDNLDDDEIADYLSDEYGWLVNGEHVNEVEGKIS